MNNTNNKKPPLLRFDVEELLAAPDFPGRASLPAPLQDLQARAVELLVGFINGDPRWERVQEVAYFLATVAHECAYPVRLSDGSGILFRSMAPIKEFGSNEYFNRRYAPETRVGKTLGNSEPGDGAFFCGKGYVQNTGRTNAAKTGKRLAGTLITQADVDAYVGTVSGKQKVLLAFNAALSQQEGTNGALRIEEDIFLEYPYLLLVPRLSYLDAADGMFTGRYTGVPLRRYLNDNLVDYRNARRVINGTDKAEEIAELARTFERLLQEALLPVEVEFAEEDGTVEVCAAAAAEVPLNELAELPAAPLPKRVEPSSPPPPPLQPATVAPAAPAGDPATVSPARVLTIKDKLHQVYGWLIGAGSFGAGIWQHNPELVVAGVVLFVVLIAGGYYLNKERLAAASDPSRMNVR